MKVFHKLADIPPDFGPTIVTVGNFDGVHRAHRAVLEEIVRRAQAAHARSVVVTFEPDPGEAAPARDHRRRRGFPAPLHARPLADDAPPVRPRYSQAAPARAR